MILLVPAFLLVLGLVAVGALVGLVGMVLRAVIFFVLLPFRLLFWALALPFALAAVVFGGLIGVVALVGGLLIGASVLVASAFVLLWPLALVAGLICLVVRLGRRPALV
jgi:hypothetical protein